ncbi:hypothetical protein VCSRO62_2287 [Vibrio cholerae]|nr:hypothetical protein VCSRO62_2287 [Vibrio cholerae]
MFVSPIGYLFFILHVFSNMQDAKKGAEAPWIRYELSESPWHRKHSARHSNPNFSRRVTLV